MLRACLLGMALESISLPRNFYWSTLGNLVLQKAWNKIISSTFLLCLTVNPSIIFSVSLSKILLFLNIAGEGPWLCFTIWWDDGIPCVLGPVDRGTWVQMCLCLVLWEMPDPGAENGGDDDGAAHHPWAAEGSCRAYYPRAASASVLISPTDPEDLLEASYCVWECWREEPQQGVLIAYWFSLSRNTWALLWSQYQQRKGQG